MKIYETRSEVEADIKDGVLAIVGDVKFECSISIDAHINAGNITARNITARNIDAEDITAWDIDARNIDAGDITAWNITAEDITARNIDAGDITAWDIDARNIDAGDISYYAFCNVYDFINCTSIAARRERHNPPVCLDGKLTIREDTIEIAGKTYNRKEVEERLKELNTL